MSDPWNNHRHQGEMIDLKADVKNKARFDDVVCILGVLHDGASAPDCPHLGCNAEASLEACHDGKGYVCTVCNETGDMIGLVRLARNCGYVAALKFLRDELPSRNEPQTMRLL